jgi:hypothetical protein
MVVGAFVTTWPDDVGGRTEPGALTIILFRMTEVRLGR